MLQINKVYLGDCLDIMQSINNSSIDMILCDLPYGQTACGWDNVISLEALWMEYLRIIKDNGAIVLTSSQPFTSILVTSNLKMFRHEWIWEKTRFSNQMLAKKQPLKIHESILVFGKRPVKYNPQGLIKIDKYTKQGATISENVGGGKRDRQYFQEYTNYPKTIIKEKNETGLHSTQKPVALFEYLIKTYSKENDLILDNCIGSGTTAIACINTNRYFIGIEKEQKYFDIAINRVSAINLPLTNN